MSYDFSDNIQRSILYLAKTDKIFLVQILNLVKPDYFEFPIHSKIYVAIRDYFEKYNLLPTDDYILEECKQYANSREPISEYEDELAVINNIKRDSIENVEYVLGLIEKFAKKESMKTAIAKSITLIKENKFDEVESLVRDALLVGRSVDIGQAYFYEIEPRWQRFLNAEKNVVRYKTLFPRLDDSLEGGLSAKELAMVVAPPGCHARGTKILMFDGSTKNVEDILVGDELMGPDSTSRTVLSLARGREEMRKVTPLRGSDSFIVNKNHILSLHVSNDANRKGSPGFVDNIKVIDLEKKSKTYRHYRKLRRVGVDFSTKNLSVNPYFLGVLLGDGSISGGFVGVTTMDEEIRQEFFAYAQGFPGTYIREAPKTNSKASTWFISYKRGLPNPAVTKLKTTGAYGKVCGDKFIPMDYKTGDRDQRLQLLAGLMDTDGSMSNNCFDFCVKSKQLLDDVVFVARSLGFTVSTGVRVINSVNYYRCQISGDTSKIPTKLKHKQAEPRKQIKNHLVSGFNIEHLPEDDYFGFELDKDHLYLTEDFVVHHNTGKSLYLVNQGVTSMMQGKKVLYVSLEMSEDKIAQRFDSVMTLVPQKNLKDTTAQLTVLDRLNKFKANFPGSDLIIKEFPCGEANINTIRNLLFQLNLHHSFKPDVLIVDYLELLRPTREIDQEYRAQQRVAEDLRGLGMKEGFLVWTATQTNRQAKSVKVITDAELGDSYGKIRTCDFAISLNQTEEEFDAGQMRVYVMKSRNGKARFQIPVQINYSTLRMSQANGALDEHE